MTVFGREVGFLLTVGASAEIAELCPDGDIGKLVEVLSGTTSATLTNTARIIVALSRGYESNRAFSEPGYVPRPLTVQEVLALPQSVFLAMQKEAVAAYTASNQTRVEVEEDKKKDAVTAAP